MGAKAVRAQIKQTAPEQIDKAIAELLTGDPSKYTAGNIQNSIIVISQSITKLGSLGKVQEGFWVNPTVLKTLYHVRFEQSLRGMLKVLVTEMRSIFQSNLLALKSRDYFFRCLNIANFCLFFSDQTLIQSINLLNVRSDIHEETKGLLKALNSSNIQLNLNIFNHIEQEQLLKIVKDLRINLNNIIDLHTKLISRSSFTMGVIDRLGQSVFILYCKLYFSVRAVNRKEKLQNKKALIKIAGAFAGIGLDRGISPLYEMAILFLLNLLQNKIESDKQIKQDEKKQKNKIRALPSHIFKTLPVINSGQFFQWLVCILIFGLTYIKSQEKLLSRLNVNRITTFKLLNILIEKFQCHNTQITYLLESLCLQIKPHLIQRVYLCQVTEKYAKLQTKSAIITKYSTMKNVAFNVKSKSMSLTFKPQDVRTELESDEQGETKEMSHILNKFVLQMILQRLQVKFQYGDKALWNMIISQKEDIAPNSKLRQDLSDEEFHESVKQQCE